MKTVLITGGSSGIGFELSKLFAADGYRLVIVSKFENELEEAFSYFNTKGTEVFIFQQDLTLDGAARKVYAFTKENGLVIDVLVNNAGFGNYGFINDVEMEKESDMIRLNILCSYQLTRLYMADMIERDQGHILNVASITAFQPSPFFATYAATKSFVLSFSRAVAHELKSKGSKVRVTVTCPTSVKTKFAEQANMQGMKLFDGWMAVTPEKVALDAYNGMKAGKELVIPKKAFQYLNELTKRLPTKILMHISEWQLK